MVAVFQLEIHIDQQDLWCSGSNDVNPEEPEAAPLCKHANIFNLSCLRVNKTGTVSVFKQCSENFDKW